MNFNRYLDNYFLGCKLIGKQIWVSRSKSSAKKDSRRVLLKKNGEAPSPQSKLEQDVYVFILPKEVRDEEGKRRYGALYPDGAPMIWPREWAKSNRVLSVEESDILICSVRQKRLNTKPKTPLSRYKSVMKTMSSSEVNVSGKIPKLKLANKGKVTLRKARL